MTFKLINFYNELLKLDSNIEELSINIFTNDCPSILEKSKTMSAIRVLQILAKNRAEEHCHELIDCLLSIYQPCDEEKLESPPGYDLEVSENSSIEIYRALTKHMTPPGSSGSSLKDENCRLEANSIESIDSLVKSQMLKVEKLIEVAKDISPDLFDTSSTFDCRGEFRIRESLLKEILNYYEGVAWAEISQILDHIVLWWSNEGIAVMHKKGAHHLKDWLHQFVQASNYIPSNVRPALLNLCDSLCCHVAATGWDELFRYAYIASFKCSSTSCSSNDQVHLNGTDTGQMFIQVFQLLVRLSNECEMGGEWVIGAPLMELPLSEQIMVLHRLDHSVHTMRLWALQESRIIAHTWNLENFFLLVKGDIVNCINELSYLKLADHSTALSTEADGINNVQVYVCAKMRGKIVSEVNTNISLLKISPSQCITILAKICRVVSLANLHMCFPISNNWRKNLDVLSNNMIETSSYVKIYLERLLLPVLEVIEDIDISNMILRIMCEAWLDYIYLHRIKFSELGALQLLADFNYVSKWVTECPIVSQNVKQHLVKNEVLRRCEGVGRLLLRHPGEAIAMHKSILKKTTENGSPESLGLETMPAEMYVPNQQQWLELRAERSYRFSCCFD